MTAHCRNLTQRPSRHINATAGKLAPIMGETIGQRIRRLRKAKGLGVGELASAVGARSHSSVSQWERDRWQPGRDAAIKLSRVLGVSVDYLLSGIEEKRVLALPAPAQEPTPTIALDVELLVRVAESLERAAAGMPLSLRQRMLIIATLYEHAVASGRVSSIDAERLIAISRK